ncbi:hypothetical protein NL676_024769 [Syzygium grande]|nr:hypothetical protein NL676_024769 [Syzygium grande]
MGEGWRLCTTRSLSGVGDKSRGIIHVRLPSCGSRSKSTSAAGRSKGFGPLLLRHRHNYSPLIKTVVWCFHFLSISSGRYSAVAIATPDILLR